MFGLGAANAQRGRGAVTAVARHADPGRAEQQLGDADILRAVDRFLVEHRDRRRNLIERSEEHTSELQSLMRISYAVICLKKTETKQKYITLSNITTHK